MDVSEKIRRKNAC